MNPVRDSRCPSGAGRWSGSTRTIFAAVFVCALAVLPVHAQMIPGYPNAVTDYDPRETAMLPPYCKFTQDFRDKVRGGNDPAEMARWQAILGPTYIHTHHYCWGLMKTNRGAYMARSAQARQYYLADSINEFDYVIARSPETFVLLPEVLTKKGENLVRLGRGAAAVVAFERAIEIKPDYWPPYAQLSDYFKELGELGKAREALERGLERVPEAPALLRRQNELNGKSKAQPARAKDSPP